MENIEYGRQQWQGDEFVLLQHCAVLEGHVITMSVN